MSRLEYQSDNNFPEDVIKQTIRDVFTYGNANLNSIFITMCCRGKTDVAELIKYFDFDMNQVMSNGETPEEQVKELVKNTRFQKF